MTNRMRRPFIYAYPAITVALLAALTVWAPHGAEGTAGQRARAMRAALIVETTTTTTTTPAPEPAAIVPAAVDRAAAKAAAVPAAPATTVAVPVPVPADITGAHSPGRADNAPLVPGHWTQDTAGAIHRDPSPYTAPTVGATDPGYEAGLNASLCAAKPWICGD
jgi:hypothetical protein